MRRLLKNAARKTFKVADKILEVGISVTSWVIIMLMIYVVILLRAFRGV